MAAQVQGWSEGPDLAAQLCCSCWLTVENESTDNALSLAPGAIFSVFKKGC